MSLREELERRRIAKNADNNSTAESLAASPPITPMPPLFLHLVKANKQRWLLPWACFHGVSYEPSAVIADDTDTDTDKCEQLRLVFMRHDVTVRGHSLAGVVDAIEETNLQELCEVAEKYQAVAAVDCSRAITEIEVTAR